MQHSGVTPPVVTAKMIQYAHIRYALLFIHSFYTWVILWLLLQSGRLARLRDWLEQRFRTRIPQLLIFLAVFQLIVSILVLPYAYCADFRLEHAFALSSQSFLSWLGDFAKARLVGFAFVCIGWLVFFAASRRKQWPLFLWSLLTPLIALSIFVYPLVVDPLFNKYTPMPPSPLKSEILALAARAGVKDPAIFVVDKSKQTHTMNAEVTGLGGSTRIVIWDTTLTLPADQVLAIVGHEMGHYVLGHVLWGFLLAVCGLLIGLLALGRYNQRILNALPARWRVKGLQDPMIVAFAMLAWSVLAFVFAPVDNSISRLMEHQADAFGLALTENGPAMARAFVSLSNINLSDPDPPRFIRFWFFSHPSLRERIDFALGIKR